MNEIKTYTGIGSRKISIDERKTITDIAQKLKELNYICLSGNADGADIAFQKGSENNCVLMLPWADFNSHLYDPYDALNHFILGEEKEGHDAAKKLHPLYDNLNKVALRMHSRNYYQIMGYDKYPKSDFVICCADPDNNNGVKGGTGQAVRVARHYNIDVINIREENWKEEFDQLIFNIEAFDDF